VNWDRLISILDLLLLVAIYLDGKKMLGYDEKVYQLYVKYFERRDMERLARNEARRRQRAAKQSPVDPPAEDGIIQP
jgi:hypothetical protein